MALMAIVAALSDLPAREFEGLLQMFLSLLHALSTFPNLMVALAQVNAVVCACRPVGSAGIGLCVTSSRALRCMIQLHVTRWQIRHVLLHVAASVHAAVPHAAPAHCCSNVAPSADPALQTLRRAHTAIVTMRAGSRLQA